MTRLDMATRQKAQELLRSVTVKAAVDYLNAREGVAPVTYEQIDAVRRGMVKRREQIARPTPAADRPSRTVSRFDDAIGMDHHDRARRSQATNGCETMAARIELLIVRRAGEVGASIPAMRSALLGTPMPQAAAA